MVESEILIGGFTPFTTIDFPDHFAAVVFMQGCLWRCPFCHNGHLQRCHKQEGDEKITWQDITDFLVKRKNRIDGLVFSGGEPLVQPAIFMAVQEVKNLGFKVALHTGGGNPEALAKILPFVDWVGLDIKSPEHLYKTMTGGFGDFDKVMQSLDMLLKSGIDFETRTTVYPKYLGENEIREIAKELYSRGVKKYVLQEYRPLSNNEDNLEKKSNLFKNKAFLDEMSGLFEFFSVRES
ncbi:MAG: anaerobic ribonucleoside-triphosphate reductase activating protein [Alphaproteobacteria bacterium]